MAVVVGFAPTPEGLAALERAAEECRRRETGLIVVRAPGQRRASAASEEPEADDTVAYADALDRLRSDLGAAGVQIDIRDVEGEHEPADDILEVADKESADVIVIGLRRRTRVGKLILGMNAQRVLLDASCPVLAVKVEDPA